MSVQCESATGQVRVGNQICVFSGHAMLLGHNGVVMQPVAMMACFFILCLQAWPHILKEMEAEVSVEVAPCVPPSLQVRKNILVRTLEAYILELILYID